MGSGGFRWDKNGGQVESQAQGRPRRYADRSDVDVSGETRRACCRCSSTTSARAAKSPAASRSKKVKTADGKTVLVATAYDVMMAQYGVPRGLPGAYPTSYDDDAVYTPAWSEKYTGMSRERVIRFAREWATTAELTKGKCTIIIGAGINHWYHGNLMYRAGHERLDALRLRGGQRRRAGALRRSGKARSGRVVGRDRDGEGLVSPLAPAERTELALC